MIIENGGHFWILTLNHAHHIGKKCVSVLLKTLLENTLTLFKKKRWVAYSPNKKMLQFAWHVTYAVLYIGMVALVQDENVSIIERTCY